MRDRICDSTPSIRPHMNVFVTGERAGRKTRLPPGADVFILTAVRAGSPYPSFDPVTVRKTE